MNEAVFISDLHLNPSQPAISKRFDDFITWASRNTKALYILGDFFHLWAGDEDLNTWSRSIAKRLAGLVDKGIPVYFIPGNRDFLLGKKFEKLAKVKFLTDPAVITLGSEDILITHGDQYCTLDKGHQWLRFLTRNVWFPKIFLTFPYAFRKKLVHRVRESSAHQRQKPWPVLQVVPDTLIADLSARGVMTVIHGHTHQPGLTVHKHSYHQYVLSDWDHAPTILCYNQKKKLHFLIDP